MDIALADTMTFKTSDTLCIVFRVNVKTKQQKLKRFNILAVVFTVFTRFYTFYMFLQFLQF